MVYVVSEVSMVYNVSSVYVVYDVSEVCRWCPWCTIFSLNYRTAKTNSKLACPEIFRAKNNSTI